MCPSWVLLPLTGLAITGVMSVMAQAGAADREAGRAKAATCQVCHGLDGLSRTPDAPHIAAIELEVSMKRSVQIVTEGMPAFST